MKNDVLKGVRVIDLTTYAAAPGAGRIMADWGAEVIKVEGFSGDPMRLFGLQMAIPSGDDENPIWEVENGNKKGVTIDLKNPKSNRKNPGFTDEERECFTRVLQSGFIDTFRYFYPDQENIYSWWSYRFHAREKNAGWRIDYFLLSNRLRDQLSDAKIHTEIYGSDHCPVEVDVNI